MYQQGEDTEVHMGSVSAAELQRNVSAIEATKEITPPKKSQFLPHCAIPRRVSPMLMMAAAKSLVSGLKNIQLHAPAPKQDSPTTTEVFFKSSMPSNTPLERSSTPTEAMDQSLDDTVVNVHKTPVRLSTR